MQSVLLIWAIEQWEVRRENLNKYFFKILKRPYLNG
jgi:hypothetical protein